MREHDVSIGQRFQKVDGTGLIFEVVEIVSAQNLPHARLTRVDSPTEVRIIALAALLDRHHYQQTSDGSLPLMRRNAPLNLTAVASN
ncbi:MAG: hypothetical protein U1F33_18080 [Alphaproteobacteria bacterium]